MKECSTKYFTYSLQNVQGHEKQGKSEELSQIGGNQSNKDQKRQRGILSRTFAGQVLMKSSVSQQHSTNVNSLVLINVFVVMHDWGSRVKGA